MILIRSTAAGRSTPAAAAASRLLTQLGASLAGVGPVDRNPLIASPHPLSHSVPLVGVQWHQYPRCGFSTRVGGKDEAESEGDELEEEEEEEGGDNAIGTKRNPSVLLSLGNDYTPGEALGLLQHASRDGAQIRIADFCSLCDASRPGEPKDAKVIRTALKEFLRCNRFLVNRIGSRLAMEGMVRSTTPATTDTVATRDHGTEAGARDEEDVGADTELNAKESESDEDSNTAVGATTTLSHGKVEAHLFALDSFLDETTGLYFSLRTQVITAVLRNLLKDVQAAETVRLPDGYNFLEKHQVKLQLLGGRPNTTAQRKMRLREKRGEAVLRGGDEGVLVTAKNTEGEDDGTEERTKGEDLAVRTATTILSAVRSLIRRGSRPEKRMRRRPATKYRKSLRIDVDEEGRPFPDTIDATVRILTELGASGLCAKEWCLSPYRGYGFDALMETIDLVTKIRDREKKVAYHQRKSIATKEEVDGDEGGDNGLKTEA